MPRTRKSNPEPEPQPAAVNGPAPGEVFTLAEAAAYLRLPEEEVLQLVHKQKLPARQVGENWRFFKKAIQEWLSQPHSTEEKEGIWAAAGSWKDDPYLDDLLKEVHRRRGRPMIEEG